MNTRSIRFRLTIWYSGLLVILFVFFGTAVYLGLSRYLRWQLEGSLANEARQVGETLLAHVEESGEPYVIDEINEHFAPEINSRFLRITRQDSFVLYLSGPPQDKSFDPSSVSPALAGVHTPSWRKEQVHRGESLLIWTLPFVTAKGNKFFIESGAPIAPIDKVLHGLLVILASGLPVVVAIAVAGGYLLTRRALAPVDEITRTAERITSRNLAERLPVAQTGDELQRLSVSLNHMIERLEEAFQHISRFTADASHELRTPLTALRGELEAISQQPGLSLDVRNTIGSALEEADRLAKIVESLLAISRLETGEARMERVQFDLAELVTTTAEHLRLLAEDKQIVLSCQAREKVIVEGDRARLKQVVVNLLDNAIKYTAGGGSVDILVRRFPLNAVVEVRDTGAGIPAKAAPHIFDRFYRADKARSHHPGGAGLGLSIVKSICAAHGGQVSVESQEGHGACFRLELPLAGEEGKAVSGKH